MFIITQFIGLYVVNYYSPAKFVNGESIEVDAPELPLMQTPELQTQEDFNSSLFSILSSFVLAIFLIFFLMKFKSEYILRTWFFLVIILALVITFKSFLFSTSYATLIAVALAAPLAYIKVFKRNFLVHNATELFIYPGIAAVFTPLLNWITILILLFAISVYDLWAVWKSGIMQKMAKYQIKTLKIFSGFLLPSLTDKQKAALKKTSKKGMKKKRMKVNIAILGGGDVIFPIITAGVFLKSFGWTPALLTIAGAALGLSYIFFFGKEKKAYPAMPFISVGILLGLLTWRVLVLI